MVLTLVSCKSFSLIFKDPPVGVSAVTLAGHLMEVGEVYEIISILDILLV